MTDVRALRDRLEQALARDRSREALELLDTLEAEEPGKARWPHRRGDILRKLGDKPGALDAYTVAVRAYAAEGFVTRAVALAKLVVDLDPSRAAVLRDVDPRAALRRAAPVGGAADVCGEGALGRIALERRSVPVVPGSAAPAASGPAAVEAPSRLTPIEVPPAGARPRAPMSASMIRGTPAHALGARPGDARGPGMSWSPAMGSDAAVGSDPAVGSTVSSGRTPGLSPSLVRAAAGTDGRGLLLDVEIDVDLSELSLDFGLEARTEADHAEPSADRLATLPAFPLFAETPTAALEALVAGSDVVELADGATVVRQGEPALELFAIVEGAVRVEVPGVPLDERPRLREGEVFGESCLFEGEPRKADVVVDGRLFALRIPRETLLDVAHRHARVGEVLFQLLSRRLLENLTRSSPLFRPFDGPTRLRLARLFELSRAAAGTHLFVEGKRADGVYVALTGRIELVGGVLGARAEVGPGAVIGQDSLLSRTPSPTTATTLADMVVLKLPSARFLEVASEYPAALEELSELADPGAGLFALELG
jgi:CRP-like cAMP-binding protein